MENQEGHAHKKDTFRLALCMSGAISAGAYTAGVIDFLFQALAEWELAKKRNEPTSAHTVRLVAMTGASAGGMTSAMAAVALGFGLDYNADGSLKIHTKQTYDGAVDCVMPRLYQAWVERPTMVAEDGSGLDFLSLEDLKAGQVVSVLNGELLEAIVAGVLGSNPISAAAKSHEFLADPLHLYLTNSNLRGIPYAVQFGDDRYQMLAHSDRRHFRISGLGGSTAGASAWAKDDPGLDLDAQGLRTQQSMAGWQELGLAALATGAFPIGLAPRVIRDTPARFDNRRWPTPDRHSDAISPVWPSPDFPKPDSDFGFVNVDGGLINNDPFEYARYCLLDEWQSDSPQNPRDPALADQAVVMISPFPEGATFPIVDPLDTGIVASVKALIPTLIQQARFKPEELLAAADMKIASRWLIAPRLANNGPPTSNAIACGALGGFGGFLCRRFREHDFQLGRRNCQNFLRAWFSLPADGAIAFSSGAPLAITTHNPQIIPLHRSAKPEIRLLEWPKMTGDELEIVMGGVRSRANAVVPLLLAQQSVLPAWVGKIVWWCKRSGLMTTIENTIKNDLCKRNQYIDGSAPR